MRPNAPPFKARSSHSKRLSRATYERTDDRSPEVVGSSSTRGVTSALCRTVSEPDGRAAFRTTSSPRSPARNSRIASYHYWGGCPDLGTWPRQRRTGLIQGREPAGRGQGRGSIRRPFFSGDGHECTPRFAAPGHLTISPYDPRRGGFFTSLTRAARATARASGLAG